MNLFDHSSRTGEILKIVPVALNFSLIKLLKLSFTEEQIKLLEHVAKIIVGLVKEGNKIVLTHGNGPQVGFILLRSELARRINLRYIRVI